MTKFEENIQPLTLGSMDFDELEKILSIASKHAVVLADQLMQVGGKDVKYPCSAAAACGKAAWVVIQTISHWMRMKQGVLVDPYDKRAR